MQGLGFPISALYHRTVFEWIVARRATSSAPLRAGSPILGALLRLDRRFVGHERGALGYILVAVASSETFAAPRSHPCDRPGVLPTSSRLGHRQDRAGTFPSEREKPSLS